MSTLFVVEIDSNYEYNYRFTAHRVFKTHELAEAYVSRCEAEDTQKGLVDGYEYYVREVSFACTEAEAVAPIEIL